MRPLLGPIFASSFDFTDRMFVGRDRVGRCVGGWAGWVRAEPRVVGQP